MGVFLPLSEENKMLKDVQVMSNETTRLLGAACKSAIDVRAYLKELNEMLNATTPTSLLSMTQRKIILKARIFKYGQIQKDIRKKMLHAMASPGSETSKVQEKYFKDNMTGAGQMHKYCTDEDIRLATICLSEWLNLAKQYDVDVEDEHQKIIAAKELKDSYDPKVWNVYNEVFIRLYYVHYLNLFTNKIIAKVTNKIIESKSQELSEDPRLSNKLGMINETKNWLQKQFQQKETFITPSLMQQEAIRVIGLGQEKAEKIYAYKLSGS